jgi:hypothetical protein
MPYQRTQTQTRTATNVRVSAFDAASVDSLAAARSATPKRTYRIANTTRAKYHETVVSALNGTTVDIAVDKLALGDSTADTSTLAASAPLGNETLRVSITDTFTDGQSFTASVFLDSTQGNGQTFEEAALVAERSSGDLPINRFLIDDPGGLLAPKSDDETVTIDIELTQEDA